MAGSCCNLGLSCKVVESKPHPVRKLIDEASSREAPSISEEPSSFEVALTLKKLSSFEKASSCYAEHFCASSFMASLSCDSPFSSEAVSTYEEILILQM